MFRIKKSRSLLGRKMPAEGHLIFYNKLLLLDITRAGLITSVQSFFFFHHFYICLFLFLFGFQSNYTHTYYLKNTFFYISLSVCGLTPPPPSRTPPFPPSVWSLWSYGRLWGRTERDLNEAIYLINIDNCRRCFIWKFIWNILLSLSAFLPLHSLSIYTHIWMYICKFKLLTIIIDFLLFRFGHNRKKLFS